MNCSDSSFGRLQAHVQIDTPLGSFLGAQRVALLEAIERHGSIARAAKAVALSYKAAWEAVDEMNNLAAQPLVVRTSGGARGGGTVLTGYARRLIAFYRALEAEHQSAVARVQHLLRQHDDDATAPQDVVAFQQLIRRWSMQSSARNQFAGHIREVRGGDVEAQVRIEIAPGLEVTGVLTQDSVQRLRLRPGGEVLVLVKSSSVMLAVEDGLRISAHNRLPGTVVRVLRGPVNAEVVLQPDGGGHVQIVATVTDDSVQRLGLRAGSPATAFFKASSVLLAVAG